MTCRAPMLCSAPDRKGSTTLMALTRPALSAVAMSAKGMATYFTVAVFTPSDLSTALVVSVWILLVRLTAMVLPASPAGRGVAHPGLGWGAERPRGAPTPAP